MPEIQEILKNSDVLHSKLKAKLLICYKKFLIFIVERLIFI